MAKFGIPAQHLQLTGETFVQQGVTEDYWSTLGQLGTYFREYVSQLQQQRLADALSEVGADEYGGMGGQGDPMGGGSGKSSGGGGSGGSKSRLGSGGGSTGEGKDPRIADPSYGKIEDGGATAFNGANYKIPTGEGGGGGIGVTGPSSAAPTAGAKDSGGAVAKDRKVLKPSGSGGAVSLTDAEPTFRDMEANAAILKKGGKITMTDQWTDRIMSPFEAKLAKAADERRLKRIYGFDSPTNFW